MPESHDESLELSSRFEDPDAAFRTLVEAHRGLNEDQSADLNARLVLLLANHIGKLGILREAIAIAARCMPATRNTKD